jgi:hypothetical protein
VIRGLPLSNFRSIISKGREWEDGLTSILTLSFRLNVPGVMALAASVVGHQKGGHDELEAGGMAGHEVL